MIGANSGLPIYLTAAQIGAVNSNMPFGTFSATDISIVLGDPKATYQDIVSGQRYQVNAAKNALIPIGGTSLPFFAAAVAATKAGTRRTRVGFVGTSINAGAYGNSPVQSWTGNRPYCSADILADSLASAGYPTNKNSFFGDSNTNGAGTTLLYDTRVSMGTGWVWSGSGASQWLAGGNFLNFPASTTPANFNFTPAEAFDTIDLYYAQLSNTGGVNIAVDGGAKIGATINTNGTAAVVKATRTTTLATHTINIIKDGGDTNQLVLWGVHTYNSAAPKIDVFNLAISASNSADWINAANPYNPLPGLAFLGLDMTIIDLAVNDANNAVATSTYLANMTTLITQQLKYGDVLLVDGTPGNTANMIANSSLIAGAVKSLGSRYNLKVVDTFTDFGSTYAAALAQGYMFAGEQIHPARLGLQRIASDILPSLLV